MSISDFCDSVSKLGWGDQPPTEAPRHIFALYVAAYEVGLTPEQFLKFMSARNFVSNITVALKNEKIAFSKAKEFLELHRKDLHPKEALQIIFTKEEVTDEHKKLFNT